MSLANKYTNKVFMDESSILDAHLRLLFRAFHYETPCTSTNINTNTIFKCEGNSNFNET